MWGKKPGEVEMGRGKKILWKSFLGTLPLHGWVQQSAGDRATEGAVPQGKNTGGMAGHCIRQNLKAQSPTQLRIEAPDTSSLSVSMSSDNTETEMAALLCVWRGRGRPVREWTGPPPTLKNSEEPIHGKAHTTWKCSFLQHIHNKLV